jgi:hypothetical protein
MIYCVGDSFTYGDELTDPSTSAWPVVLGKLLNKSVTNLGKNGTGNTRIVKRTIDLAFRDDAELIILSWVGPYRVEFFNKKPYDIWPGRQGAAASEITKALTVTQDDQFDLWLYRKWLRDIILTQNLLQNRNKKYLMAQAWYQWGPMPGTQDLWDKINWSYFVGYPDSSPDYETFGYWCADAPKGSNNHPLELAHQQIARKFYDHIRNLSWFS